MKWLGLVFVLCGSASLAVLPGSAGAFEIQGAQPDRPDVTTQFAQPQSMFVSPEFKGYSLATPYSSSQDSPFVSDYGNSIPIPAPGVSLPAPAWTMSPSFR